MKWVERSFEENDSEPSIDKEHGQYTMYDTTQQKNKHTE